MMRPRLLESNDETLFFEVPSESRPGLTFQVMHDNDHHWLCTCEHYHYRKQYCKHMRACADMMNISDIRVYAEMKT